MTIEILIGVEVDDASGKPIVRLTPVHTEANVPDTVGELLFLLYAMADSQDGDPDGEWDIPLSAPEIDGVAKKLNLPSALVKTLKSANGEVFVKLRKKK